MKKPIKEEIEAKISVIEDELHSIFNGLHETSNYLLCELDQQKLLLAKIILEEKFAEIESEDWS
jgi:hypothetical protein